MSSRSRSLAVILPVVIAGAAPAAAPAQGPGVKFDEDSPAGKEYAIPLDDARKAGGGGAPADTTAGDRPRARGSADAALFGAGIAKAGATGTARDKRPGSKPSSKRPAKRPEPAPASREGFQVERAVAASGGRQRSAGLVIGAAALLLVALATILLRLRRRTHA